MTEHLLPESSKKINYKIPPAPCCLSSNRYSHIAFKHLKLTQERLKMLLHYDLSTGLFKWVDSGKNPHKFFIDEFNVYDANYTIRVDGNLYVAAHLAHLYMEGSLPKRMKIVYLDGMKRNNIWANLKFIPKKDKPGTDGSADIV